MKWKRSWLALAAVLALSLLGYHSSGGSILTTPQRPEAQPARRSPTRTAEPNWVVVAPNKRYLMFEDGKPFVPIGIATSGELINLDYFGATSIDGRPKRFRTDHVESLFADMKAHGENFLRVDIEGTGHWTRPDTVRLIREGKLGFLESPVGTFKEDYARRVDRLITLAAKYDIYLGLVLIAHTCDLTRPKTGHFDLYPYSAAQGGPLRTMDDLFTSAAARKSWVRRMEYISDRWGGSRRVVMWELYNELLNCGGQDPAAAGRWVAEMGNALRQHELSRYGKAHPVIVSPVSFVPEQRFFADSTGTDLMVAHIYTDEGGSGNPVEIAKAIHEGVRENLATINYSRPFLENERTLSWHYPDDVQQKMEHAASWALLASGAASPGASWFVFGEGIVFRNKAIVSKTHKAMRTFLDAAAFSNFKSRPVSVPSSNREVVPMVLSDGSSVLGWVLHDNPDDYDIDNINAWRSGRIKDKAVTAQAIGNWVRIVDKQNPSRSLDAHFDQIGNVIAQRMGIPHAEAVRRAKEILGTPAKAARLLRRMAAEKGRDFVQEKVRESMVAITATLEEIERRQGTLKRTYRGHPKVTSDLTVEGLSAGSHRVVWYDDNTGAAIRVDSVRGSRVVLRTPAFSEHIAFTIVDEVSRKVPTPR